MAQQNCILQNFDAPANCGSLSNSTCICRTQPAGRILADCELSTCNATETERKTAPSEIYSGLCRQEYYLRALHRNKHSCGCSLCAGRWHCACVVGGAVKYPRFFPGQDFNHRILCPDYYWSRPSIRHTRYSDPRSQSRQSRWY